MMTKIIRHAPSIIHRCGDCDVLIMRMDVPENSQYRCGYHYLRRGGTEHILGGKAILNHIAPFCPLEEA